MVAAGAASVAAAVGDVVTVKGTLSKDKDFGAGYLYKNFPAMVRQFIRYEIDITKEPMLVYPSLHYQNGGVAIKPDGSTDVPNLFVAGEASGGVHGRNRLMGNSLLDICVFGRRAGAAAAQFGRPTERRSTFSPGVSASTAPMTG